MAKKRLGSFGHQDSKVTFFKTVASLLVISSLSLLSHTGVFLIFAKDIIHKNLKGLRLFIYFICGLSLKKKMSIMV